MTGKEKCRMLEETIRQQVAKDPDEVARQLGLGAIIAVVVTAGADGRAIISVTIDADLNVVLERAAGRPFDGETWSQFSERMCRLDLAHGRVSYGYRDHSPDDVWDASLRC